MAKRVVLVRNMGNSGGAWLMKILTMHEKILMLTEINQVLRLRYVPKEGLYPSGINLDFDMKIAQRNLNRIGSVFDSRTQCDIAISFLIQQFPIRKEEVIGLIKCFDPPAIAKCRKFYDSVKVFQTIRNPVGIIDFYLSQYKLRQIAHDAPSEKCFKEHVDIFYKKFTSLIKERDAEGHEIIKLEDINVSLRDKTPFFKGKMENIFEVEWSNDFINKIIVKEGYGDDGTASREIWKRWSDWKKEYFMGKFKLIMENLGYMFIVN